MADGEHSASFLINWIRHVETENPKFQQLGCFKLACLKSKTVERFAAIYCSAPFFTRQICHSDFSILSFHNPRMHLANILLLSGICGLHINRRTVDLRIAQKLFVRIPVDASLVLIFDRDTFYLSIFKKSFSVLVDNFCSWTIINQTRKVQS